MPVLSMNVTFDRSRVTGPPASMEGLSIALMVSAVAMSISPETISAWLPDRVNSSCTVRHLPRLPRTHPERLLYRPPRASPSVRSLSQGQTNRKQGFGVVRGNRGRAGDMGGSETAHEV